MNRHERAAQQFVEDMLRVSLVLIGQTPNGKTPQGSGVMWQYQDRHFLLSVGHTLNEGEMFIETRIVDPKEGALLIHIPDPISKYQSEGNQDFGWAEIDFAKLTANLKKDPRKVKSQHYFECYTGPLDAEPKLGEAYGFAKWNGSDFVESTRQLIRDPIFEVGMEFDGVDKRNGYYRFIPMKHKGDVYKGCSGAPIADPSKQIVALVQGGCEKEGVVWGVPVTAFAKLLPITGG